jgi:hypothetical protein
VVGVVDDEGLPADDDWLLGVLQLHTKRGKLEPQVDWQNDGRCGHSPKNGAVAEQGTGDREKLDSSRLEAARGSW